MKRTACYLRSSTLKQEKGHQAQKLAVNNYCQNKQIEKYRYYEDFGISGTKESRPGLNELMKDCRDGKINHVVVYSFSRFARSTKHLLEALDTFQSLEIQFTSISEDIDSSTPMGKMMFVIISALSSLERDILSERTKLGLKNAIHKGKILGRPRTRNSKLIIELNLKGYSQREISKLAGCSKTTVYRELKSVPNSDYGAVT